MKIREVFLQPISQKQERFKKQQIQRKAKVKMSITFRGAT